MLHYFLDLIRVVLMPNERILTVTKVIVQSFTDHRKLKGFGKSVAAT